MLLSVAALRRDVKDLKFVHGTAECLPRSDLERIGRYRHKVFVDGLGWKLESHGGIERDQFDRLDTLHVAAFDARTQCMVGVARLLPTHRPYLLADVFPQLVDTVPRHRNIWELSRFAAADELDDAPRSQIASPVARMLMQKVLAIAAANHVQRLITVSPIGMLRLLRAAGFAAERAGQSTVVAGARLEALWIEVPLNRRTPSAWPCTLQAYRDFQRPCAA